MSRKSEREFVGGDMSDEEFAALNGDTHVPEETYVEEVVADNPQADAAPAAEATAPTDQTQPADAEPKMVDIRALQEARSELRKRDEEIARQRETQARIEERLSILNQALAAQAQQNAPKPEEPKLPSKDEDPLGFYEKKIEMLEERLSRFDEMEKRRVQMTQQEQQHDALIRRAASYVDNASANNPQVNEALQFALQGLQQEIGQTLAPYNLAPEQFHSEYNRMWRESMANMARRMPADPNAAADFVIRNARYYGWGIQQTQPAAPQAVQQDVPPPTQAQPQQPTIQQRAEQQQRHMSLSGVSGAEPPKQLDAKTIASMPEKEWREFVKTAAGKKAMEEHFGGF